MFDTTSQAYYYHNLDTDETTWVLPAATAAAGTGSDPAEGESSKSSPSKGKDSPEKVAEARKPEAAESIARAGGAGGGGGATSRKRSKRRDLPTEDGGGERRRADGASGAGDGTGAAEGLGKEAKTAGARGSGKGGAASGAATSSSSSVPSSPNGKPKAVAASAVAAKEGDSASITESLPRYGRFFFRVQGGNNFSRSWRGGWVTSGLRMSIAPFRGISPLSSCACAKCASFVVFTVPASPVCWHVCRPVCWERILFQCVAGFPLMLFGSRTACPSRLAPRPPLARDPPLPTSLSCVAQSEEKREYMERAPKEVGHGRGTTSAAAELNL